MVKDSSSKYERRICIKEPSISSLGWLYNPFMMIGKILLYVFIAYIIIYFARRKLDVISWVSIVLLAFMFYMVFENAYSQNVNGSLPFATYPLPPHLGLYGISNEVRDSY